LEEEEFLGTGSIPPGLNGWQRTILLIAKLLPFKAPNLWIDVLEYSEQDG